MSFGLSGYGIAIYGSIIYPAPDVLMELGEFNFYVESKLVGSTVRVFYSVPSVADSPTWTRRIRILRKWGEWPQAYDDGDAELLLDDTFPALTVGDYFFDDSNKTPGAIYYYALFALRNDGQWINDTTLNRDSAYPYDRWGAVDYGYKSLPRGYRTDDTSTNHLYQFLGAVLANVDALKTDCENLLSLFSIESIHQDLLWLIDSWIGWPTWKAAGGLRQREETLAAADWFRTKGTKGAYEELIEGPSDWDLQIQEGWKFVCWTNGRFSTGTVDTTDVTIPPLIGTQTDKLRYTPDSLGWHSCVGLGFFLVSIPAVSQPLTTEQEDRLDFLIEWGKASFVTIEII